MDPFFSSFSPSTNFLDDFHLWDSEFDPSFNHLAADHLSPPPPLHTAAARRSSFSIYTGPSTTTPLFSDTGKLHRNIPRRAIELARKIHQEKRENRDGGGSSSGGGDAVSGKEQSRGFRHMMRERQRREKLSQSYADLYSILPPRTKADKNSIVQAAATMLGEMKKAKEGLVRRNEELMRMEGVEALPVEAWTSAGGDQRMGGEGVITVRAENPAAAIDSVIATLRCLERMDVKATAIRSRFAGEEGGWMTTKMNIETNKGEGVLNVQEMMEKMLAVEGWRLKTN